MTWRGAIEILGLGEGLAFKRWHQEKKKKKDTKGKAVSHIIDELQGKVLQSDY